MNFSLILQTKTGMSGKFDGNPSDLHSLLHDLWYAADNVNRYIALAKSFKASTT